MRSRREFMKTLALASPVLAVSGLLAAEAERSLAFLHTHTAERLQVAYFNGLRYLPGALARVNHVLRDFRTGDVHPIDPDLLDLLHDLAREVRTSRPFEVISGYRSPATNARLHRESSGVAASSLHMTGQAIDIRLADVPLARLREAALDLRGGGVGYYPASNFVHVDTGRVRTW